MQSHLEKSSCLKCKAVESKSIKSNFEWLRTRRMCWMTFSRKTLVKMTAFLANLLQRTLNELIVWNLGTCDVQRLQNLVEKDKLAIWECRHLRRSHPSFLQLLSRTKAIYFGQLGKILWVRLPSIHSCCQPWWQFMSWSSTLTLNEAEELQWLGILSKTPDIERQHDDDILNFQPFFLRNCFCQSIKDALTWQFYVPKKLKFLSRPFWQSCLEIDWVFRWWCDHFLPWSKMEIFCFLNCNSFNS